MLLRDAGGGGSVEAPSVDTDAFFSDAPLPAEPATAITCRARRLALGCCCTAVAAVAAAGARGRGPLGGGEARRHASPRRALPATVLADEVAGTWEGGVGANGTGATASTTGGGDSVVKYPETGCGNWRKLAITEAITVLNPDDCATACEKQPGCVRANFQLRQPGVDGCTHEYSITVNSCYLFGTSAECDCIKSHNPCWQLLEPRSDLLQPALHGLLETGTGCSNWGAARIGEVITNMWNHHMCAKECQYTEGCLMFSFQQRECTGTAECGDQEGFGRCILLSDVCDQETNQYWDLYAVVGAAVDTELGA